MSRNDSEIQAPLKDKWKSAVILRETALPYNIAEQCVNDHILYGPGLYWGD